MVTNVSSLSSEDCFVLALPAARSASSSSSAAAASVIVSSLCCPLAAVDVFRTTKSSSLEEEEEESSNIGITMVSELYGSLIASFHEHEARSCVHDVAEIEDGRLADFL